MLTEFAFGTLLTRLARGPAFLMLGQGYLKLETGTDPFLSEVFRKYGPPGAEVSERDKFTAAARRRLQRWRPDACIVEA